jgi:hypothetical protein
MENNFKEMNMYQKLFYLQQNVAMEKDKEGKNYIYRNLDDMLKYLKPIFNLLRLFVVFPDGEINNNIKRMCLTFTNIDNPSEIYTITDSCVIDMNPRIMSYPQSSNSTDTFLQKRILEHVLLLTTEPDPDGIDWKDKMDKLDNKSQILYNILNCAEKGKIGTKEELLKAATAFKNFSGYTDILKVSDNVVDNLLKKISNEQIVRLMAIAGTKNIADSQIKIFIHKIWGKFSKKDLNYLEYSILCGYLDKKKEVKK